MLIRDLLLVAILALVLTLASILFVDQVVDLGFVKSLLRSPMILLMNYIPVLFVMLIFYFVTGSVGGAFIITGSIILVMGMANQNKLFYRDDNIRATDLRLLKEAFGMVEEGNPIKLHKLYFIYPVFIVGIGAALIRYLKSELSQKYRVVGLILSLAIGYGLLNTALIHRDTYWNNSMERFHPYIEVERAKDRGMSYTFVYGYRDFIYKEPEDYDPAEVEEFLAQYTESMPAEDEKVDIILILGESYADLESIGADVDPSVYAPLREIQQMSHHGNMQNYAFGGGTIETERNILAGVHTHGPYIKNRNTFVWMLKDEGYDIRAMHPYTGKFYNRINTNKYLGIDNFLYSENYFDDYFVNKDGEYFPDDILFPLILEDYEKRDKSKPYFNFIGTMQNHTPYSPEDLGAPNLLNRETFAGSGEEYNSANNYFFGIRDTGEQLLKMINELEEKNDPVVVIFYGDHLARLGAEGELYGMMGINTDLETEEGWLNNYTTPYLIWGSSAAQELIGKELIGEGPHMSNYFLFGYALEKLGFETPYIQYLNDRLQEIPIDATSYTTENGKLTSSPSQETMEKKWRHNRIQYWWTTNFLYDEIAEE